MCSGDWIQKFPINPGLAAAGGGGGAARFDVLEKSVVRWRCSKRCNAKQSI